MREGRDAMRSRAFLAAVLVLSAGAAAQTTSPTIMPTTLPGPPRPAGRWASLTPPPTSRRIHGLPLQDVIDQASTHIIVPAGTWNVGALVITASNVHITGESGAVLVSSGPAIFTVRG